MSQNLKALILPVALLGAAIIPKQGFGQAPEQSAPSNESRVRQVMQQQQAAWNRGDIDTFMDGYWRSPETVFVSGDEITRGWQTVRDRYRSRYSDREKMGTLTFSDLEIRMIGNDAAVVLGRWQLQRRSDTPHGCFTLVFRNTADGWKIIHDHTSSVSPPG